MGCAQSEIAPQNETPRKGCTDVLWLVIYILFWILMIIVAAISFVYGNPQRLINGFDSFGNTCGVKTNQKLIKFPLAGISTIDKKFLFFMDVKELRRSLKICVKECPNRKLESLADIQNFYRETGSNLCRYDINPNNVTSTKDLHDFIGPCPTLPVYDSFPLLNRCFPKSAKDVAERVVKDFYDLLNSWDTIEQMLSDLYSSWKEMIICVIIAFICSLLMVSILHLLATLVSWIFMIIVSIASVAGTALLWYTYYELKHKQKSFVEHAAFLDESLKNETAFLWYSIIATIITVILLILVFVMRSRVSFLAALFKETAHCLGSIPALFLQPIITFFFLILFFAFWSFVIRGSDELLSQSGVTVMAPAAPHHADNNNQDSAAKKVKLEQNVGKPSRVIHIRNIPNETTEAEIIQLGLPFGRVTNVLVLKGKNQAFLEMAEEISAVAMVAYFGGCVAQLRGRAVYVQFSNHKELKTDQTHSNASASAQAALQAAQVISNTAGSALVAGAGTALQPANGGTEIQGGPNTVLRVIIEHMLYPIVLDVLYSIFQRYGKVLKIVTFTKNNSFQALIQYPDTVSAQTAKTALDGQNIYNGCCTLRIDYSKMTCLNVKYNNDKSRDYTNPTLPSGDSDAHQLLTSGGVLAPQFLGLGSGLASPYGVGVGGVGLPAFGALTLTPASPALRALAAPPLPLATVLLVSNLNEEMVTPDALFTLFGVYGDVQRVKILYNKKDSALIQMAEPHQAHLAMTHMDKLRVFGKAMRVMLSKHQTVQLPKEGQPDAGLTRDYSQSPLHRFKKPGSKNYQNIYPPSATLHLSNIPATVSEDDIKDAFTKRGFTIKAFKFFPKDRKMALVQLPSIDDAVAALIKMHNYQLSESNHLRVSFSKSSI